MQIHWVTVVARAAYHGGDENVPLAFCHGTLQQYHASRLRDGGWLGLTYLEMVGQ